MNIEEARNKEQRRAERETKLTAVAACLMPYLGPGANETTSRVVAFKVLDALAAAEHPETGHKEAT